MIGVSLCGLCQVFGVKVFVGWSQAEAEEEVEEEKESPRTLYTVAATLTDESAATPSGVTEVVRREDLEATLRSSDIIIFHTWNGGSCADQATWAAELLCGDDRERVFVCISPCLTWGRTKPADPEDPELPLTEEDYRRRKAHPNFKAQLDAEKAIVKLRKKEGTKLHTYVLNTGIPYGRGERSLHWLFKSAWLLATPELALIGSGENVLPMIHVLDLAFAAVNVVENKPEQNYIVAVDDSQITLRDLTSSVTERLGPGAVKAVSKAEGLLLPGLAQADYDAMTVNIRLTSNVMKDFRIDWVAQSGLLENLDSVIAEYRQTRGLLPIQLCLTGPPASGKTWLARRLCQHYKLRHLGVPELVAAHISTLEASAALLTREGESFDEASRQQSEDAAERLAVLQAERNGNAGQLAEATVVQLVRDAIGSRACANHGYLLDGFPETTVQAQQIFAGEEDADILDPARLPAFVFTLEASDDLLLERMMNLPEEQLAGTDNAEAAFKTRLALYRNLNTEDVSVLNFFDELEIHPVSLEVASALNSDALEQAITTAVGQPHHYGPTPEERAELERKAKEHHGREQAAAAAAAAQAQSDAETAARAQIEWDAKFAAVKQQEAEMLEAASQPLRHFLMQKVMPTLTKGLMEVCQKRPTDPIDYLATFLFEQNPQLE